MEKDIVMDNVYIGRQPILDANRNVFAYEILYRQDKASNYCNYDLDDFELSINVLSIALNNIGINKLLNNKRGFINIDETLLNHKIIQNIPKEKFYLEILETTKITDSLIKKVDELKEQGYTFILDDFTFNQDNMKSYDILFPRIDYIKVDLQTNSMQDMQKIVKELKRYNIGFLAEKVETQEEFEKLKEMGYELFQGYFFSKPDILSSKKIDPTRMEIVKIIGMIYNRSDLSMIIKRFENHPNISINLLKFLNSSYFNFKNSIQSIKQAITLLGINKLKNWLTLLLYINEGSSPNDNPLFEMIKNRSDFMVEVLRHTKYNNDSNREIVYLTGLLSKIDMVLNMDIQSALDELHIDTLIKKAIIDKEGFAGDILSLAEANKNNDIDTMDKILDKLSISIKDLTNANLISYQQNSI